MFLWEWRRRPILLLAAALLTLLLIGVLLMEHPIWSFGVVVSSSPALFDDRSGDGGDELSSLSSVVISSELNHVDSPLVSVVIASGRGLDVLLSALDSVFHQSLARQTAIEVLLVISANTVEEAQQRFMEIARLRELFPQHIGLTIFRLRSYADVPPRSQRSHRAGYFRTIALSRSRGHYVAFLDDDDCWAPVKLEMQLPAMRSAGALISSTDSFSWYRPTNCSITAQTRSWTYCRCPRAVEVGYSDYLDGQHRIIEDHTGYRFQDPFLRLPALAKVNIMITSSVVMDGDLARSLLPMLPIADNSYDGEDYHMWRRALQQLEENDPAHAFVLYLHFPLVYYDQSHGTFPLDHASS